MNKLWKLYHDKENQFEYKSFENNKDLESFNGYDFIYYENYNWEYSNVGCIYEMWDCVIKPGDVVLDIGANLGFFTCRSAEMASKVIAVDGSPEAYSCLVENCKDLMNVQTINCSILGENSDYSWLWSYKKNNPLRMTLDELMDLYKLDKIDFIKCDIEGGEYDLFGSLSEETLSKIDRIAVETHDEIKNESFFIPGKIRHTYHWNYGGGSQTMFYFTTPK
jgi:FkbM family methyltransferase